MRPIGIICTRNVGHGISILYLQVGSRELSSFWNKSRSMTAVMAALEAVPKSRRTLSTRPVVRLTSWKSCTIGQQLGRSPGFVSLMKGLKYGKWILIDLGVDQGTHFKTWTLAIESWSEEQKGKTPQVPECSRWPLGLLQGELSLRRSFSSLCPSRGDLGASDIDIDWLDLENEIAKWITPSFLNVLFYCNLYFTSTRWTGHCVIKRKS